MDGETFGNLASLLFTPESPVALAINRLIFLLFALALADVARALAGLARESRRIERASGRLRELDPVAGEPAPALLARLEVPPGSLLGEWIERLLRLRAAGLASQEALGRVVGERVEGFGAFARWVGGVLTLLGLVGTVLGLSSALFRIQGALNNVGNLAALDDLTASLGSTLHGMKTAFSCTLAGLATAFLLSVLNHALQRRRSRVGARLEDLTACELLPFLERVDPGADEAARSFARVLTGAAEELARLRSDIPEAALLYGEAAREIKGAGQSVEAAVRTFADNAAGLAGDHRAFVEALAEAREAAQAATAASGQQVEEMREQLAQGSAELSHLFADQRAALAAFSDLVADLALRLGSVLDSQGVSASPEEAQRLQLERLRTLLEPAVAGYHEEFKAFVGRTSRELESTLEGLLGQVGERHGEAVAGQLESGRRAYEDALARSLAELEGLVARQGRELGTLFAQQKEALTAVSDMVIDARLSLGVLADRLATTGNGHATALGVAGGGR